MHRWRSLGEGAHDAKGFGWSGLDKGKHSWETLRQNVQDHIKGLNFAYRVQLREVGVTYINKLGKGYDVVLSSVPTNRIIYKTSNCYII
jgi:thioredoxin reductase (NADPH)